MYETRLHYTTLQKPKKSNNKEIKLNHKIKETLMKLFKTKPVLSLFVTIQTNITIITINTINIINIKRNAPKVPLYNLKTLTFSPTKSILLQFLSLNTKLLIKKFLIQKTDLRKKEISKIFVLSNG